MASVASPPPHLLLHPILVDTASWLGGVEVLRSGLAMGIPQPPLAITLAVNFPVAVAAAEFLAAIKIAAAAFGWWQLDDGIGAQTPPLRLSVCDGRPCR